MTEKSKLQEALGQKYSLHEALSQGGMGAVYSATDNNLMRQVAIKVIVADTEETTERFQKEVKALSRINHKNIPALIDAGSYEDILYYITEFEPGDTFDKILSKNKQLSLEDSLNVALAVAEALSSAHKLGIVHRDLKPSNILICDVDNRPDYKNAKVLDFGVSGIISRISGKTQVGQIYGTPHYMSPEQFKGEAQSSATDVFGLGILLYEMIFGQRPFIGTTSIDLMNQVINENVKIPKSPIIPSDIQEFILQCLEKDASKRPKNPHIKLLSFIDQIVKNDHIAQTDYYPTLEKSQVLQQNNSKLFIYLGISVFTVLIIIGTFTYSSALKSGTYFDFILGFGLLIGGILIGLIIKTIFNKLKSSVRDEASQVLFGTDENDIRKNLEKEAHALLAKCRATDERILGQTIAIMIGEYKNLSSFDERKNALVTAVELIEKLTSKMSPWYIKYDKLIIALVSILGLITGAIKIIDAINKL